MAADRFEQLSLAELREEAQRWEIPVPGRMRKKELILQLRQAESLNAATLTELRNRARTWQIPSVNRLDRSVLVSVLLRVERLRSLTLPELRELARQRKVESSSRIKKDDLIRRLVQAEPLPSGPPQAEPPPDRPGLASRLRRLPWSRWLGRTLQAAGLIGATASLILLLATPILASRAIPQVRRSLSAAGATLRATAQTLNLSAQSMGRAAEVLRTAGDTLTEVGGSLRQTQPLMDSVAELVGDQAPRTIEDTQSALESSVAGARAIDQVLRTLARFGPLTGVRYDPETSLEQSLSEAAAGLVPLPATLRDIRQDLLTASAEIDGVQSSMDAVATDLDSFSLSLRRLEGDLEQKAGALVEQAVSLEGAVDSVGRWLWPLALLSELWIVWVGMSQIVLWLAGGQLVAKTQRESK